MDDTAKRAILAAAAIAAVGLALTINQMRADIPVNKEPKFVKPSATTMQTAVQPSASVEQFYQCTTKHQMPCVDMGAGGQFMLFEAVPGKAARQTPVIVATVGKKDGDTFYLITRE